jgi:predicted nucleic acid-binding protein
MRICADTSWWLAYKCRRDTHHVTAITLFDREPDAQVLWTPWQRVEVSIHSDKRSVPG